MLDQLPIGEELIERVLKCELCGMEFDADNENDYYDFYSIEECGACTVCDKNRELAN